MSLHDLQIKVEATERLGKGDQKRERGCHWPSFLLGWDYVSQSTRMEVPIKWKESNVCKSTELACDRLGFNQKQKEAIKNLTTKTTYMVQGVAGTGRVEMLCLDVLHGVEAGGTVMVLVNNIAQIKAISASIGVVCSKLGQQPPNIGYLERQRFYDENDTRDWATFDIFDIYRTCAAARDLDASLRKSAKLWAKTPGHECHNIATYLEELNSALEDPDKLSDYDLEDIRADHGDKSRTLAWYLLEHGNGGIFKGKVQVIIATPKTITHPWFASSLQPSLAVIAEGASTPLHELYPTAALYMESCSMLHVFADPSDPPIVCRSRSMNECAFMLERSPMGRMSGSLDEEARIVLDEEYRMPK